MSVEVDRDLCMGSGVCIAYAPATFAHDAETKAVVKMAPVTRRTTSVPPWRRARPEPLSVTDDDEGG